MTTELVQSEVVEVEALVPMVSAANDQVDLQITTAHRFPRSIARFRQQAMSMATIDEETAAGCFYNVPRDGKTIEGPSIRLAEICTSAWGNLRVECGVIDAGDREITAEGTCWDLETNVAIKRQVKRRITKRNGQRYSDDMVITTGNAACAIALRNAVFSVVPRVYVDELLRQVKLVAIGKAETLVKRRQEMIGYFGKMGIVKDRLLAHVGKPAVDDLTLEDVFALRSVANAIKDGATSIDEAFPTAQAPKTETTEQLKSRLRG